MYSIFPIFVKREEIQTSIMLTKLHVKNFKSIKNQEINLKRLNILVGQNGAGKSNFISLFTFLERAIEQDLSEHISAEGGIDSLLFNGDKETDNLYLDLTFPISSAKYNEYRLDIKSTGEGHIVSSEIIAFGDSRYYINPWNLEISSRGNETNLKNYQHLQKEGARVASHIYKYLKDLKVFHFHDTSNNAAIKKPQDIGDVYTFKKKAENIAPFLAHLKENHFEVYQRIVDTVKLVFPTFNDFDLRESPKAKEKMLLRWTEKGKEEPFIIRQISDGTLRFICLATLLLQPLELNYIPKTIVLDEPELGLHPLALRVLSELIKKASQYRQVIVATQSVTLLEQFSPEDLMVIDKSEDGQSTFKRFNNEQFKEWLEDYTLGELWENNLLGGRP